MKESRYFILPGPKNPLAAALRQRRSAHSQPKSLHLNQTYNNNGLNLIVFCQITALTSLRILILNDLPAEVTSAESLSTFHLFRTVSGGHWMIDQRQLSCMLLLRLASTIATQSMQGRRRWSPTSCNECSMLLDGRSLSVRHGASQGVQVPVWSVIHGSLIAV